jgi:serine phosphatase RsbU (regulator of sigma subunit)
MMRSHAPPEAIPLTDELLGVDAVLAALLRASHTLEPDDLPAAVAGSARRMGAVATSIHLADYEQQELRQLVRPGSTVPDPLQIDATAVGRVFRTLKPVELTDGDERRLVVPLVDGMDRIGVLEVVLPVDDRVDIPAWLGFAALVAELVVVKSAYGDSIDVARRRQAMALRAEAQRSLLPPLTIMSPRVLVTGMLVPSYEVAGDVFDYALNGDTLHFGIIDAMGHSLSATLTAAVVIAAYRNSRRGGGELVDSWAAADGAVATEFDGERFATAVFGEVDLVDGLVRTVSAGHPSALVVRENRVVARCDDDPTLPIGLRGETPMVTETWLQPGDRLLLFTDGIVEARSESGEFFGEERLVEQLDRALDTGLPAPEAVRRLVQTVSDHQNGSMRDDATLLMVEWRGGAAPGTAR